MIANRSEAAMNGRSADGVNFDRVPNSRYTGRMDETKVLNEVTRIILSATRVTRIVLFGSRARGDAGRDSDFDLFILVQDGVSPAEAEKAIRLALISPDASFDIVVCTESEYNARKQEGWRLLSEIEAEGRQIYAA